MKVLWALIIVVFINLSCKQKSVQLPTLDVVGIQDTIYNNSKIKHSLDFTFKPIEDAVKEVSIIYLNEH